MIIPERFDIFGKTFSVSCNESALVNESDQGHAGYRDETIVLLPPDNMYKYSRQSREQTFCHELFHHWFAALNLPELQNDEQLVDNLGSLLHQFMESNRGVVE